MKISEITIVRYLVDNDFIFEGKGHRIGRDLICVVLGCGDSLWGLVLLLLLLQGRSRDEGKTERDEGEGDIEKENEEEKGSTETLALLEDIEDEGVVGEAGDERCVQQKSWSGVDQGKECTNRPQFTGKPSVKKHRKKHHGCSKITEREVGQVGCAKVDDGREKRGSCENISETLSVFLGILALNQDWYDNRNEGNHTECDDEHHHTITALRKSHYGANIEDSSQATEPYQLSDGKKSTVHSWGREIDSRNCKQQERSDNETNDDTVLNHRGIQIWAGQQVDVEAAMHVGQQVVETAQKRNCRFSNILLLYAFCRYRAGTITEVGHADCDGVHAILSEEGMITIRNSTSLKPDEPGEISKLGAVLVDLVFAQAKGGTGQHLLSERHCNVRNKVCQSIPGEPSVAH